MTVKGVSRNDDAPLIWPHPNLTPEVAAAMSVSTDSSSASSSLDEAPIFFDETPSATIPGIDQAQQDIIVSPPQQTTNIQEIPGLSIPLVVTNQDEPGFGSVAESTTSSKSKEMYRFTIAEPMLALSWSNREAGCFRLAAGTYLESDEEFTQNKVVIIEFDEESGEFIEACRVDHGYPPSGLIFSPNKMSETSDILATATDGIKVYRYDIAERSMTLETCMRSKPLPGNENVGTPFTSIDWQPTAPDYVATSCYDSTCSVWNIEHGVELARFPTTCRLIKQIIAHDKNTVNTISFNNADCGSQLFATGSHDCSARMFDLRDLGSCTVFYNDTRFRPIDHVAWNPVASNLISVVPHQSFEVITIDIRNYRQPVGIKLHNHKASINGIAWAPHNADHFCTVGSDHLAQLFKYEKDERLLEYKAGGEINNVKWSKVNPEFMAINYKNTIEVLRV